MDFLGILTHPLTGAILAILGIVVSVILSIALYLKGINRRVPKFTILGQTLETSVDTTNQDVQLTWKGDRIANIQSIKIGIWNAGRTAIRKSDISVDQPLKIAVLGREIKIISSNILAQSRSEIGFSTRIVNRNDEPYIEVAIGNDEAIEETDGLVVSILFTGELTSEWRVEGRVFDVPEGVVHERGNSLLRSVVVYGTLLVFLSYLSYVALTQNSSIFVTYGIAVFTAVYIGLANPLLKRSNTLRRRLPKYMRKWLTLIST